MAFCTLWSTYHGTGRPESPLACNPIASVHFHICGILTSDKIWVGACALRALRNIFVRAWCIKSASHIFVGAWCIKSASQYLRWCLVLSCLVGAWCVKGASQYLRWCLVLSRLVGAWCVKGASQYLLWCKQDNHAQGRKASCYNIVTYTHTHTCAKTGAIFTCFCTRFVQKHLKSSPYLGDNFITCAKTGAKTSENFTCFCTDRCQVQKQVKISPVFALGRCKNRWNFHLFLHSAMVKISQMSVWKFHL